MNRIGNERRKFLVCILQSTLNVKAITLRMGQTHTHLLKHLEWEDALITSLKSEIQELDLTTNY